MKLERGGCFLYCPSVSDKLEFVDSWSLSVLEEFPGLEGFTILVPLKINYIIIFRNIILLVRIYIYISL